MFCALKFVQFKTVWKFLTNDTGNALHQKGTTLKLNVTQVLRMIMEGFV